ncbi:UDP pyrophosphate synthase [Actinobaculum suis]|uniref:polyprenyl diphosphate synthase n=1 Tax=Actinobaculum suis TaxID=1657 RepID=UPI00066FF644|nr:UDP pyrophosphate synthase [Actinobaculum suis]
MGLKNFAYRLYDWNLRRELAGKELPRHVAIMLDGNRRWAKQIGKGPTFGHARGASKIGDFLGWCDAVNIEVVTLWLLSTDNVQRDPAELGPLLNIIARTVEDLAAQHRWSLQIVGSDSFIPQDIAQRLRRAEESSENSGRMRVNIAVGYGGRQEIVDAVRAYLRGAARAGHTIEQAAADFELSDITNHLYTAGQPDPDLVIRTSGEQRMSGFLLWQSVHTELYFCEAYWPDFRRTDFLRALRDYTERDRRRGK